MGDWVALREEMLEEKGQIFNFKLNIFRWDSHLKYREEKISKENCAQVFKV